MENQFQYLNGLQKLQKSPVAPIGLIAPPGGKALATLINAHLVKRRKELIQETPEYASFPGFSRENFELACSCPHFASGEGKAILEQSIRGYDIFLITDVGNYGCTFKLYGVEHPMSPDEHFQELKRVVSVIGRMARRITVIMPYLYEGRQDRRQLRESLSCAIALQELENLGVSNVVTFDAHDTRVQNAVPLMGFDNLHTAYQIISALLQHEQDLKVDRDHMMVVSPDEGAVERCLYYVNTLGLDIGLFYKRRDTTRIVNGKNPIIDHEPIHCGHLEGKDILLVDDMLASGESILRVAQKLKARHCGRIFVAVAFAQFTEGLDSYHKAYEEGLISRVYATNLTYRTPELLTVPWFVDVDVSEFLAYFIDCLNRDESISALLDNSAKIAKLLQNFRA
jgi:ribose-phosphate pyrophosphokinase